MRHFVDPDDFCRACSGKGYHTDWDSARGVTVTDDCRRCKGTGQRTVLVLEKKDG